ncbi:MAG TPA: GFA family protein [Candidatus Binataceae bacterium]|nr:GFA family protein [Candidatus Binataceae bacterium]
MLTGGCLCGAVRYEVEGTPLFAVLCHCRDCQRVSGTGHVPVMGMPRSSLKISGATKAFSSRGSSGLPSVRHFCPNCGSLLFGMPESVPDSVSIYVGSLDDPSAFQPAAVIFRRDRHAWDIGAAALDEFDTLPSQGRE